MYLSKVVGIIFRLGKFTGNESFRKEIASPLFRFLMLNCLLTVKKKKVIKGIDSNF
jgi:hypothetical protein